MTRNEKKTAIENMAERFMNISDLEGKSMAIMVMSAYAEGKAAEAEFIKTHIVDYEKIFDVCMNGDDLEFKKGLVRLQKMQNEYVMQREND